MKKVVLVLAAVATLMSCTPEEVVEVVVEDPIVESKFTGVYEMTKFIRINTSTGEATINVVLDCPQIWNFQDDFNLNKRMYGLRGEDCVYKYMSDSTYSSLEEGVVFLGDKEFEVFYREDSVVLQEVAGSLTREQYTLNEF
tara:strand:- start:269 stop:691 length:423 start_codon:yes stop_codon:yes gene_type:complete